MAQFLEMPQLVDQHRVAEVQVRSRRIEPRLHTQRTPGLETLDQFRLDKQFIRATLDKLQATLNIEHLAPQVITIYTALSMAPFEGRIF
jgi:hypothetical protein